LAQTLKEAAQQAKVRVHYGGTYLSMEGPQFSTLAESQLYRSWGMSIIGMTNMNEARLAREAQMCYATLAAITDYDCWHSSSQSVTVEMVLQNLAKNVDASKAVIAEIARIPIHKRTCQCADALQYAIVTNAKYVSKRTKQRLRLIAGRYFV
jgi:5'-methylthioadenosine phosphorylase